LNEILIRFLIGGAVVSAFSIISDLFKPKTFAGLFGAAPSIALASLGLAVMTEGKAIAATEARSMIVGAVALLIYAAVLSYLVLRFRLPSLATFLPGLLLWLAVATGLWRVLLI
jgi:hypothetical protein